MSFSAPSAFVSGMIIIWSGSTANIPTGFVLCDGQNSTPDLRNRFVVGAGNNYNPGDTGGADSVTLTEAQMPQHNHGINDPQHNHGINDPGHFHTTNDYVGRSGYSEPRNFGVGTDGNANSSGDTNTKNNWYHYTKCWNWYHYTKCWFWKFSREQTSILCPLLHYEDLTPGSKSTIIYG